MNDRLQKFLNSPLMIVATLILFIMVVVTFLSRDVTAQAAQGPFTLPSLPYAYNALDSAIDEETMRVHHGKHHQAYIDKLNDEVARNEALTGKSLGEILATVSGYNDSVRNNAGGHWNHSFFWTIMAPANKAGAPSAELTAALEKSFGSLDQFKTAFNKAGTDRFGSGWVWLVVDQVGGLKIISTPNQDNPLMDDAPVKGMPILGNDVWEHAYYLRYQNRRGDYMQGWWAVVNWEQVNNLYRQAVKSQ